MLDKIKSFIDGIFNPIISFLDLGIERLQGINLITARGINLSKYFSVFGDMPAVWQSVIVSLLASTAFLGGLLMYRSIMRIYYATKEGVKWW